MRSIILFLFMCFSVINGQSFFSESPTKLIPGHFIFSSNSFIQDAYDEEAPPELDFSEDYGLDEYREFAEQRGRRVGTMNIYVADHLLVKKLKFFDSRKEDPATSTFVNDFPSWLAIDNNAFTSVVIKVKSLQSLLVMNSTATYSFIGAYKDLIGREPENSAILGLNTTNLATPVKTVEFKQDTDKVLEVKSNGEVGIGNYDLSSVSSPGLYVNGDVEFTGRFFGDLADPISIDASRVIINDYPSSSSPVEISFSECTVPANSIAFVSAQVQISVDISKGLTHRYDLESKIEMLDVAIPANTSISYIDSDSTWMSELSVSPFLILENNTQNSNDFDVKITITPIRSKQWSDDDGEDDGEVDNYETGVYIIKVSKLTGVSYKAIKSH